MRTQPAIGPAAERIERLCAPVDDARPAPTTIIVAAHPDDEVIGAGARLARLSSAHLIYVTDGAPRDLRDARAAGFRTRAGYAAARRDERAAALALAGIKPEQTYDLEVVDQEASFQFIDLVPRLARVLRDVRPEVVLTLPYEGGHPDHDAAAFVVHQACRGLGQRGAAPPTIIEFTSYHERAGTMAVFEFLPDIDNNEVITRVLSESERRLKRQMVERHATQQAVLRAFPIEVERFRPAPRYDFTRPPHPGRLYYERFDWGVTGAQWRARARQALDVLK